MDAIVAFLEQVNIAYFLLAFQLDIISDDLKISLDGYW